MKKFVEDLHVGIDLGTTTSVVSILENDGANIRPLHIAESVNSSKTQRSELFRSAVNIKHDLVGPEADSDEVRSTSYFNLKKNFIEDAHQVINEKGKGKITPYEYQLKILNKMYENSMNVLNENNETELSLKSVTVTVPTDFKSTHRELMLKLVKETKWGIATKVTILDEPIAASIAKLQQDPENSNGHWITYDLGGGTFDSSLLETFDVDDTQVHKVHINRGDLDLGGFQFDEEVWKLALENIQEKDVIAKLNNDKNFYSEFKTAFLDNIGDIKMMLDHNDTLDEILKVKTESYGIEIVSIRLNRSEYWNAILPYIQKTIDYTREIIDFALENKIKVNGINFVGGSTKDPHLRKFVKKELGIKNTFFNKPEQVVSMGAAVNAGIQYGGVEKIKAAILDTISSPIGITLANGTILWVVSEGDPLPITKTHYVSGVSQGQTSLSFSLAEASKLYYGIDQLQGNYFISKPLDVHGFRRTSGIPQFAIEIHVDENKVAHFKVLQEGTGVTQTLDNVDVFSQKGNLQVEPIKKTLLDEAIDFAAQQNSLTLGHGNVEQYLKTALSSLATAVSKRPELASSSDLRDIARGANDALDMKDAGLMHIWLNRITSVVGQ